MHVIFNFDHPRIMAIATSFLSVKKKWFRCFEIWLSSFLFSVPLVNLKTKERKVSINLIYIKPLTKEKGGYIAIYIEKKSYKRIGFGRII